MQSTGGHRRATEYAHALRAAAGLVLALLMAMMATADAARAAGRQAAMVIDANSGQVLHAQAADEPRYPASLTKLMTVYIVFEMMEQGRLSPATRIRISAEAADTSPSRLGLEAGSEIALIDAVQALIVKSANDMAVAVAEHIAGSETKFAALMTEKARQLGMAQTTFRNAHGLPDAGQVTTARDMLTLALRLNDDFPRRYAMFAQRSFSFAGVTHRNHNTMLASYPGMDGLKTGYTAPSGFNLVASVRRNGRHLVAVVFGGASASSRNAHMRAILDRALVRAATERMRRPTAVARAPRPERATDRAAERAPAPKLVEPVRQVVRPAAARSAAPPPPARRPAPPPAVAAQPASTAEPAPATAAEVLPAPRAAIEPPPPAATVASVGAPVEVAKVRTVAVAPRPRREPAPTAAEASAEPAAAVPPPTPGPVHVPAAAAAMPPRPAARGAPPSSLQAQAERLRRGEPATTARLDDVRQAAAAPAPAFRLNGPAAQAPAVPAARGGEVMIQIGAYRSEAEAQRQLQSARARAADMLAAARPVTQPVTSGGLQLYRARFAGFDAAGAAKACNELRRQQIDCLVTPGG